MTGKRLSEYNQVKAAGISAMDNNTQDQRKRKLTSEEEELFIDTNSQFLVTNNGSARLDRMSVLQSHRQSYR
jgi:hypothetical protein